MGEYRTEHQGVLPASEPKRKKRRRRVLFWGATIVLLLVAAAFLLQVEATVAALGYVTSEEHAEVRAAVQGTVARIHARTGDIVIAGELLIELDQHEAVAALEEERSRYHKAEAELILRRAQVEEAQRLRNEQIRMDELRLAHADRRLERTRELSTRGLVAGAALADAEHEVGLLTLTLETLRQRDEALAEKEIQVLERELQAREEAVNAAESRIRSREIRAPIAGQVLRYAFVPGELVRPELVLMEIFGGERQVLKLRIAERHAMRVNPGDRYEARLGAYRGMRGRVFYGDVEYLRNVIQDEDRHPYRAAYCSFDAAGHAVPPGTSAEARIYTGKQPLWRWLTGGE